MANAAAVIDEHDVSQFEFDLNDRVTLLWSGGEGVVIGRRDGIYSDTEYLVQYVDTNERLTEQWVHGDAIDAITVH